MSAGTNREPKPHCQGKSSPPFFRHTAPEKNSFTIAFRPYFRYICYFAIFETHSEIPCSATTPTTTTPQTATAALADGEHPPRRGTVGRAAIATAAALRPRRFFAHGDLRFVILHLMRKAAPRLRDHQGDRGPGPPRLQPQPGGDLTPTLTLLEDSAT